MSMLASSLLLFVRGLRPTAVEDAHNVESAVSPDILAVSIGSSPLLPGCRQQKDASWISLHAAAKIQISLLARLAVKLQKVDSPIFPCV